MYDCNTQETEKQQYIYWRSNFQLSLKKSTKRHLNPPVRFQLQLTIIEILTCWSCLTEANIRREKKNNSTLLTPIFPIR